MCVRWKLFRPHLATPFGMIMLALSVLHLTYLYLRDNSAHNHSVDCTAVVTTSFTTMAPILYMLPPCPPVRAILMTAKELGVELELRECNILKREQYTEEYLKMNPAHTIPTFDDNGFIVFESAAVMGYLVGKYGKTDALYPKDFKKRALVDQLLHFSTQSFATFVSISRPIILSAAKKDSVTDDNKTRLMGNVEVLDKMIGDKEFVAGDKLTIADFSFVAWVSSLDVMYPITEDRYPNVVRWWKKMEKLPSYKMNVEGLAMYKAIWGARE